MTDTTNNSNKETDTWIDYPKLSEGGCGINLQLWDKYCQKEAQSSQIPEIYPSLDTIRDWANILGKYWGTASNKLEQYALERFQTTDQLQSYYDHLCTTQAPQYRQERTKGKKSLLAATIINILTEQELLKKQVDSESELTKAIKANTVIKCEKLLYCTVSAYMVLRELKGGVQPEWAVHFYNVSQDSFEFGYYSRDFKKALKNFHNRVKEYNGSRN